MSRNELSNFKTAENFCELLALKRETATVNFLFTTLNLPTVCESYGREFPEICPKSYKGLFSNGGPKSLFMNEHSNLSFYSE